MSNLYLNADCMTPETGLPSYPDNYFDLAIVDPPYGIGAGTNAIGGDFGNFGKRAQRAKSVVSKKWDGSAPDADYFREVRRVSKNQIIWGANYFAEHLPPSMGWIFWDKGVEMKGRCFSEGELAFSSFDRALRIFVADPKDKDRIHPTQKPIALYQWLLKNYAKQGDLILDTHVGSASSLVAFEEMGFEYVGYELDADYYRDSCKRLEAFRAQPKLFTGKEIFEASKPPTLF